MTKSHKEKNSISYVQVDKVKWCKFLGIFRKFSPHCVYLFSIYCQLNITIIKYKMPLLTFNKAINLPLLFEFKRKPINATSLAQGHFVTFRPTTCGYNFLTSSFVIIVPSFHWRIGFLTASTANPTAQRVSDCLLSGLWQQLPTNFLYYILAILPPSINTAAKVTFL